MVNLFPGMVFQERSMDTSTLHAVLHVYFDLLGEQRNTKTCDISSL